MGDSKMYVNKKTKVLAALPDNATRETEEKSHEIRSEFQRDRDRILKFSYITHCTS